MKVRSWFLKIPWQRSGCCRWFLIKVTIINFRFLLLEPVDAANNSGVVKQTCFSGLCWKTVWKYTPVFKTFTFLLQNLWALKPLKQDKRDMWPDLLLWAFSRVRQLRGNSPKLFGSFKNMPSVWELSRLWLVHQKANTSFSFHRNTVFAQMFAPSYESQHVSSWNTPSLLKEC